MIFLENVKGTTLIPFFFGLEKKYGSLTPKEIFLVCKFLENKIKFCKCLGFILEQK